MGKLNDLYNIYCNSLYDCRIHQRIKRIPTKQWSFLVSFVLLILVHIANRTFNVIDLILYALTAISISLGSNGLSDYNKKAEEKKDAQV